MCSIESSSVVAAGFGTLKIQVAGFHRAVPSTTLDKACMQFLVYSTRILQIVNIFLWFLPKMFTILIWTFPSEAVKIR